MRCVMGWNTVLSCLLSYSTHRLLSWSSGGRAGDCRRVWHPKTWTTQKHHARMQYVGSYLHSGGGRGAAGAIWSETYRQTATDPHPESRAEGRTTLWASAPVHGALTTNYRKSDSFARIGSFEQFVFDSNNRFGYFTPLRNCVTWPLTSQSVL